MLISTNDGKHLRANMRTGGRSCNIRHRLRPSRGRLSRRPADASATARRARQATPSLRCRLVEGPAIGGEGEGFFEELFLVRGKVVEHFTE
jgi:hypothetical protein